jgi:excisionase family DNA binding protein
MDNDAVTTVTAHPTTVGQLYTTAEVAKLLRVHQRTVQEWIRTGALPCTALRLARENSRQGHNQPHNQHECPPPCGKGEQPCHDTARPWFVGPAEVRQDG